MGNICNPVKTKSGNKEACQGTPSCAECLPDLQEVCHSHSLIHSSHVVMIININQVYIIDNTVKMILFHVPGTWRPIKTLIKQQTSFSCSVC